MMMIIIIIIIIIIISPMVSGDLLATVSFFSFQFPSNR